MISQTLIHLRAVYITTTGLTPNVALVPADDYDELFDLTVGSGPIVLAGMTVYEVDELKKPAVAYVVK